MDIIFIQLAHLQGGLCVVQENGTCMQISWTTERKVTNMHHIAVYVVLKLSSLHTLTVLWSVNTLVISHGECKYSSDLLVKYTVVQ